MPGGSRGARATWSQQKSTPTRAFCFPNCLFIRCNEQRTGGSAAYPLAVGAPGDTAPIEQHSHARLLKLHTKKG